jgi:CRP/FNR family transcriptional regulator
MGNKNMNKLWYLKQCDVFSSLDKEKLAKIAYIAKEKNIPKNEIIYSSQDKNEQMFIIKKGRVRIFKISADGKIVTLAILGDENIFGTMSAIRGGTSGTYAETLEDSYICAIHQDDFSKAVKEMPEIALKLIEIINQRLKEAEQRIEDLVFRNIPGRIAGIILKLSEQFGKATQEGIRIDFKITHQELADMVGATRETVTLILNDFKNDNLIKISEKYITIMDEGILKEWAGR